jgi:carboxypeptidase Taq
MSERDAIAALREHLAPIHDLQAAAAVLAWDQQTYMPAGSAGPRADQLATLATLAHRQFTDARTGELIAAAEAAAADAAADSVAAGLVRVSRREYDQAVKLPADFVTELTKAASLGQMAWVEARKAADFAQFLPALTRMFELTKQKAEYIGYREHPYDALLDTYEPGLRTAEVRRMFDELRSGLAPLVGLATTNAALVDDEPLRRDLPAAGQLALSEALLRELGFDFTIGRQDLAAHPFCTSFAPTDVRVTTRIEPNWLSASLFGSLHEMGHGLYEQGVAHELMRTPLATGVSLGMHESQSRMWENMVGRSLPFWRQYLPLLHEHLPQLRDVGAEQFYRAVNRVTPSFIRVEADEVTYNYHILLRFELELALIEGTLKPAELPGVWNEKMREYLGIVPANDAMGVLQDVHWSEGLIGYFPTYTLGNVMAGQLYAAAVSADSALAADVNDGRYGRLLEWLRTHVHRYGAILTPGELLQRATGSSLTARPYLDYLTAKFTALYRG